jgi:hypothetical protein
MGSNVTRQKRRAEFMKLPIAELTAWHLMVTCTSCRDARYLPIEILAARYGTACTLADIVPRLRCRFRTCRQPPAVVKLFSSLDDRDARTVAVVLVGPGAF